MGVSKRVKKTVETNQWHRANHLQFGRAANPETGVWDIVCIIDGMTILFSEEAAQAMVEGFTEGLGIIRAERN